MPNERVDSVYLKVDYDPIVEQAMPRPAFEGLSEPEFSVMSRAARHRFVCIRWELRGNHTGEILGYPPTGRELSISGLSLIRFEGSKPVAIEWAGGKPVINRDGDGAADKTLGQAPTTLTEIEYTAAEEWTYWDIPALLEQLGGRP
jgi:hypothetical protein